MFVAALVLAAVVLAGWAATRGSDSLKTPATTLPISVASTLPTARPTVATTVPETQAPPTKGRGNGNGKGKDK